MSKIKMKQTFTILMLLSLLALAGCNTGTDNAKELELKEKELKLKEKELELAEKESDEDESDEKTSEKSSSKSGKPSSTTKKKTSSKSTVDRQDYDPDISSTSDPDSKTFFVIFASTPQSQPDGVKKTVENLKRLNVKGYKIIDTNKYPKLKSGLFSVVLGPYTKSDAQRILKKSKEISSDLKGAYIKAGS